SRMVEDVCIDRLYGEQLSKVLLDLFQNVVDDQLRVVPGTLTSAQGRAAFDARDRGDDHTGAWNLHDSPQLVAADLAHIELHQRARVEKAERHRSATVL